MEFAEILKSLMNENGLSKYRLAKLMHCSQTTVQNWISKTTEPQARALAALSDVFNVPVSYLLGETDRLGLSDDDWVCMASTFSSHREQLGLLQSQVVDGDVVTENDLSAFESGEKHLTVEQLHVICGMSNSSIPDMFPDLAERILSQKNKPAAESDELQSLLDDERTLLHSYRTLTDDGKKMMQILIRGIKDAD